MRIGLSLLITEGKGIGYFLRVEAIPSFTSDNLRIEEGNSKMCADASPCRGGLALSLIRNHK
jgi:hypothetical protein